MSDMMQKPPMGGAPMGGAPASPLAKPNAITNNMSSLNPADNAMMAQSGSINSKMTVKDWVENVIRVPINAPISEFMGALKSQMQNRNAAGKAKSMGSQAPPMGGMGAGSPAPQAGGGLQGLMGQLKG